MSEAAPVSFSMEVVDGEMDEVGQSVLSNEMARLTQLLFSENCFRVPMRPFEMTGKSLGCALVHMGVAGAAVTVRRRLYLLPCLPVTAG